MPGLSGVNLAKEVLKIKPSMPIIMCTGHSETVSEENAWRWVLKDMCTNRYIKMNSLRQSGKFWMRNKLAPLAAFITIDIELI